MFEEGVSPILDILPTQDSLKFWLLTYELLAHFSNGIKYNAHYKTFYGFIGMLLQ